MNARLTRSLVLALALALASVAASHGARASTLTHLVVYFQAGSATLDKTGEKDAQSLAQMLRRQSRLRLLEVAGHCDKGEAKSKKLAKKLSQQRADTVRNRLIALGIKPSRLVTKAYGFSQPIGSNTPEGIARNRRVNLRILEIGVDTNQPQDPPKKKRRRGDD